MSEEGDRNVAIDAAMQKWQQGDCALGPQLVVHRFRPGHPLTPEARDVDDGKLDLVEAEHAGVAVISQTCDIVRACAERPLVNVCPLVEPEQGMEEIQKRRRSRYAFIQGVAAMNLVGDLDRIMSVEKSVVATWPPTRGCRTDREVRSLAFAVGRKFSRFPFPDDFTAVCGELQNRLKRKHGKDSAEGDALRALREIRVLAAPSWDSDEVSLTFLFIREDSSAVGKTSDWDQHLQKWLELVPDKGRFKRTGVVTTLEDLTGRDYVDSDPLDLDHLSGP